MLESDRIRLLALIGDSDEQTLCVSEVETKDAIGADEGLEGPLREWLACNKMQRFADFFVSAGVHTLTQAMALNEASIVQMGILLPGHRRKLLFEVARLNGDDTSRNRPEPAVSYQGRDS